MKIRFSYEQLQKFVAFYSEMNNTTRLPANFGYTPEEMIRFKNGKDIPKITFTPVIMRDIENDGMNEDGMITENRKTSWTVDTARKHDIGRNELCPCGSGLKYKKCCGRNIN